MRSNKKIYTGILLFFLFLIFIKIDYRTAEPNSKGTADDTSYYFHSSTIAKDFDLDYSNQIDQNNIEQFLNRRANTYVPIHPFGTGLLSSPVHFLGILLQKLFKVKELSYFIYSLSSLIYLAISYNLLAKILGENIKHSKVVFTVSFFGSGSLYYATERFSMTHIYEIFATTFLLYLSFKAKNNLKNSKNFNLNSINFLIGFLSFVFLSIRWSNYFIFLIPLFYFSLFDNLRSYSRKVLRNIYFYLGLAIGCIFFLGHTFFIYGFFTFNPTDIYSSSSSLKRIDEMFIGNFSPDFVNFIVINITNFIKILFSFEFGLFFISPVLFMLFIFPVYLIYKKEFLNCLILLAVLILPIGTVLLWQTTASSFGYRYLFSLVPIGLMLIFREDLGKVWLRYLLYFGIFSIISTLFFETNQYTILSEQINTFGILHKYSAPKFVLGVITSIFTMSSYLKIFFTSYLGVFFIKLLLFFNLDGPFYDLISRLGYWNEDVEGLFVYSQNFYSLNYIFLFLIFYLFKKSFNNLNHFN